MPQFDNRIFQIVLNYGTTQLTIDEGGYITASGQKFANALQDECTIQIANLQQQTRNLLATQLTPFNRDQARKSVTLSAGRVSTGLFPLYSGDIVECTPSQPPNIVLTIKSKTCQFFKNMLVAQSQNLTAPLSQITQQVASTMGLGTRFEATDKTIANYSYTGSAIKQVDKLGDAGAVDAYVDGQTLVVKDKGEPLKNETLVCSEQTGMIGIPELTEYGVRVKMLLAPTLKLGGSINLTSVLMPLLNGVYVIYKLGFEIASRDTNFYSIIEAAKYDIRAGAIGGLEGIQ